MRYIYRITAVFKVETDIIASIAVSLIGWTGIMHAEIFKTDVIDFIGEIIMYLTSRRPIIFSICQLVDINQSLVEIKEKHVQSTNKWYSKYFWQNMNGIWVMVFNTTFNNYTHCETEQKDTLRNIDVFSQFGNIARSFLF